MEQLPCKHGAEHLSSEEIRNCVQFFLLFADRFCTCGPQLPKKLSEGTNATLDKYPDVWKDSFSLEMAISYCLSRGTQDLVDGNYDLARLCATFARHFEQHIAVISKQTHALPNWPKLEDTYRADDHTLVNFFRRRIPCCCLGEKYEEVKHITKMGWCYSKQCSIPGRTLERSQTKYCSRCRNVSYCSRACQVADWSRHKPACDMFAAMKAEFDTKLCTYIN